MGHSCMRERERVLVDMIHGVKCLSLTPFYYIPIITYYVQNYKSHLFIEKIKKQLSFLLKKKCQMSSN